VTLDLHQSLKKQYREGIPPSVTAYHRIDGPGSSLDLREFQQAFWRMPDNCQDRSLDPSASWSRNLPRTVGITIDSGTFVEAHPFDPEYVGLQSFEFNSQITGRIGKIAPTKENWLLKIIEVFGISGVMFKIKNLKPETLSSGLGGSATVATGVCLLANELSGRPFSLNKIVTIASRIEQDLGVSITGTQEQSNVVYGGVTDYIWFPWGLPDIFGNIQEESIRYELVRQKDYHLLEERMAVFHSGIKRLSSDINKVWRKALFTEKGFALHSEKIEVAYEFREGLRLYDWARVLDAIRKYRIIRTDLCSDYLHGSEAILKKAEMLGGTAFPLGAGGGGAVLTMTDDPDSLTRLKNELQPSYREIPFRVQSKGHRFINLSENYE
jgi:D-glycero-alpha-D-manno-heptose-7-phosphate kinase